MTEVNYIAELAKDPITLVAVTIFLHTVTEFIKTIKSKGNINVVSTEHTEQLASINRAVRESISSLKTLTTTVSAISATQEDISATRRIIIKKLEELTFLANNLFDLHKDPDSKFATVRLEAHEREIIQMLHEIKLTLAGLR